jgi:hypothetical protein
MSFRNYCPDHPAHQNTPESIAKGNALMAEAKTHRDMGVKLGRTIEELEKARETAFELSRSKQFEAETILIGRPIGRY